MLGTIAIEDVTDRSEHSFACSACPAKVWVGPAHGKRSLELADQVARRLCTTCYRKLKIARAP